MNGNKIIEIFNNQILEIISQSYNTFDEIIDKDKRFQSLINSIETTISITPSVPITLFYNNFSKPFEEQISKKDDVFFLNFEVKDDFFELLKYIYKNTTEENKTIIWDYILRLKTLSIKYYDKKKEPLYHEL